jgi:hypothetical protein
MITSLRSLWERIRLDIIPVMEAIFPADSIACFKNKIKSGTERFDKQTKQNSNKRNQKMTLENLKTIYLVQGN